MTSDQSSPAQQPEESAGELLVVVLDVANVMGSRPDGWWRDRAGAASRVLTEAAEVCADAKRRCGAPRVVAVVAVVEGAARAADDLGVAGLEVVRAPGSGDDTIVDVAQRCVVRLALTGESLRDTTRVVVVTADRGLRARLPGEVEAVGPRWWWDVVDSRSTRSTRSTRRTTPRA